MVDFGFCTSDLLGVKLPCKLLGGRLVCDCKFDAAIVAVFKSTGFKLGKLDKFAKLGTIVDCRVGVARFDGKFIC